MLSQMGQSMCSILEYQTLIDINVVNDDPNTTRLFLIHKYQLQCSTNNAQCNVKLIRRSRKYLAKACDD